MLEKPLNRVRCPMSMFFKSENQRRGKLPASLSHAAPDFAIVSGTIRECAD